MKTLKTTLHGFMITLLCVLLLCSCDSGYKPIEGVISDHDDESKIQVDFDDKETSKTSDNSTEQTTGEFSVKAKKYAFEGNDLLILDIHNQTNKNCNIDITVNYKDESGNVVKTEKQNFTGFAADYQNYFLFTFIIWPCPMICGTLFPQLGIEPPPSFGRQSLSHWAAGELSVGII